MAVTQARLGILRLNAGRLNFVAPTVPHSPIPPHLSYAGPLVLQWQGAGQAFDVYFGTTTTPPLLGTTTSLGFVAPPLTLGTVYYWRVVAHANALGPAQSSALWQFTATAPAVAIYLAPPNHSVNQVTTGLVLQWEHPVVSAGDTVFDVYFGPVASALPLVSRGQAAKTFNLGALAAGVDYYWRIVSRNNAASVSGPTWTFETRNPTKGLITIGGVDVRERTRLAGVSVRDLLADTPNTASFTIEGTAPTVGKEVRIGLASLSGDDVIFGGYIDTVEAIYEGRPENRAWRITAQDYTYGLNRRKVRNRYGQASATVIALDLLGGWAPSGYTGTHIVAGLPIVTGGIDFTEEDLTSCFARLAQRIGGYWYVDYARDVHLFLTEATAAPTPITRAARVLLADPPMHWSTDLTQIRTRVFVEGGGSQARANILVGATVLPVTDGQWYSPSGGLVVSGPQRIRYTGKASVGGGAALTATPQLIAGAVVGGPFSYVWSSVTDGNEGPLSAPSAPVTLSAVAAPATPLVVTPVTGLVAAPASAVTLTPISSAVSAPVNPNMIPYPGQQPGNLDPAHYYYFKVTYVTANGETLAGPRSSGSAPNTGSNSIELRNVPISPDSRVIARRVYRSFWTGWDFSPWLFDDTIQNNSSTIFNSVKADSAMGVSEPTTNTTGTGKLVPGGDYGWQITFGTATGETPGGPFAQMFVPSGHDHIDLSQIPTSADGRVIKRKVYRTANGGGAPRLEATINDNVTTTYRSGSVSDGALGAAIPTANTTGSGGLTPGLYYWTYRFLTAAGSSNGATPTERLMGATTDSAQLSGLAVSSDARVTKRQVFRTTANGGTFKLEVEINDNTTTTYTSTKRDDQLGADLVWGNTTSAAGQIALSGIPVGPVGTTARKLYRTPSGGAAYLALATISDNSTTTFQDNRADATLGASAVVNEIIQLVGIPASGAGSVRYEVRSGDDVNIFVQCDDAAAQAALAALEGPPSQGIVEHVLQDRRLGLSEATATGFADLTLFARPIVTINYATRDPKTRSGKTVHIDLPELSLEGDFTIQTVEIDEIDLHPGLHPKYRVTCSSVRFSFEDAVRRFQLET
jgi:hypothetical protein